MTMENMSEGLYMVGEYRGVTERESNGKVYYKLNVLCGDSMYKLDIKPEMLDAANKFKKAQPLLVQYFEWASKFGINKIVKGLQTIPC